MRIERPQIRAKRGWAKASLVLTAAFALSACEGGAPAAPSGISAAPAASATLSAELSPQTAPFAGPPFPAYGCEGRPYLTPAVDLVIVASRTVNVDQVILRMLDGSSLGGPMITFPQAGLSSEFGTTLIAAGHSRRFRFHPRFPCGGTPRAFTADLALVDLGGATHALTVSGSLR